MIRRLLREEKSGVNDFSVYMGEGWAYGLFIGKGDRDMAKRTNDKARLAAADAVRALRGEMVKEWMDAYRAGGMNAKEARKCAIREVNHILSQLA